MRKIKESSQRPKRTKRKLFPTIQGGEKVRKKGRSSHYFQDVQEYLKSIP